MITQLLPSAADRGKHLGVINIASTLPQVVVPPIGAVVVNYFTVTNPVGFQILFGVGWAAVIGGILIMRALKK
jgi:MFS family permease